jgi:MFS family permease
VSTQQIQAEAGAAPPRQTGFWTGQAVSFLGTEFSLLGLPVLGVVVLGLSPAEMGVLVAAAGVPALAGPLFAGPLADVFDRRLLCVRADALRCAVLLAVIPLYLTGKLTLLVLIGLQLILGTAGAIFDAALFAWLPALFSGRTLVTANGRIESLRGLAQLVGPAIAGALMQATTAVAALFVDGLSFGVSALSLSTLRSPGRAGSAAGGGTAPAERVRTRYLTLIGEGFLTLWRLPAVALLGTASGLFNLFAGVAEAIFVYMVTRELGMSTLLLGVVLSAGCVGGALSGLLAARIVRRVGLRTTLTTGLAASCVAEFATAAAPADPVVAPILLATAQFVATFGVVAFITANATLRQALVPDHVRGRVFAVLRVLTRGAVPIGAVLGGLLAASWSARGGLLVAGAGQVAAAGWLFARRAILPTDLPAEDRS